MATLAEIEGQYRAAIDAILQIPVEDLERFARAVEGAHAPDDAPVMVHNQIKIDRMFLPSVLALRKALEEIYS